MVAKLWTKDFILLLIANAFSFCAFDLLLPTLPVFLVAHGNNSGEVGIVMGIFTFSAIFIRLFTAEGSRRFGLKNFLYIGLIICCISISAYSLGTTFITAAAIRIMHGLGFGITTTLSATIAANIIPDARRGEGTGYLGFGMVITASLAPFLGLWLLEHFGGTYLFVFTALTQLYALVCIFFVSVPKLPIYVREKERQKHTLIDRLVEKAALFPSLLTLMLGICSGSLLSFIALFGQEKHITNVGWFFLAATFGSFAARLVAGNIFDRKGHAWVIMPGALIYMVGFILISQATSKNYLMVAAVLIGLGGGALFPSLQAWIMNRTVPERRGEANAMFYNAFDVGVGGGSILLGFIAAATSYGVMYLFAAFVMLLLFAVYVGVHLSQQKKEDETAAANS